MNEVILIILIGLSPGNPDHPELRTLEYHQESMESCLVEKKRILEHKETLYGEFDLTALCVERVAGHESNISRH